MKGEMITTVFDKAKSLEIQLVVKIEQAEKGLLYHFPVDQYIAYLDRYPLAAHYRYVSDRVREWCEGVEQKSSEKMLEIYHRLLMVKLILRARHHADMQKLPPEVRQLVMVNFQRILKKIESGRAKPGDYLYTREKNSIKTLGFAG